LNTETYFAMLEDQELTSALIDRVRNFQRYIITTGYFALGAKSAQFTQGMDSKGYSSAELRRRGPRGEYTALQVPHYASLYNNFISQLTGQRIVFDPQPGEEDWRATEQARRAKGLLQDELEEGLEEVLLEAVDYATKMGMAWTAVDFDPNAGPVALPDPDTGQPVRTGALSYRAYMPQDWAFDIEARKPKDAMRWGIGRRLEDAHDLIAQFPEKEREILAARGGSSLEREVELRDATLTGLGGDIHTRTRVPLYEFRHDATPGCPNGRLAWFLGSGVLLFATDLPFVDEEGTKKMCVRRLALKTITDTAFGFTPVWLLMALQEAQDMLASIELSNYRAHGVGLILNPRGSDITPRKVAAGLSVLDHTPNLKPELANFTSQPIDIAGAQERAVGAMQTIVNVSAIDRGDPPASLKSGSALLFVKATTAQAMQPYLGKMQAHHEGVASDFLFVFTIFVRFKKPVRIRGELAERVEEISGEDIGGVSRVRLELGNPLARSYAGQVQMATDLMQAGQISKEEYLEVMGGGGIEKMLKASSSQRVLIEQENSFIRQGRKPLVSPTDNHPYHMQQHAIELNSQQARLNPTVRQAVLNHVFEHQSAWEQATLMNPGLLEALGILPMQSALGAAMGAAGAPPGEAPPEDEGGGGQPMLPSGEMNTPPDGGQMPQPPRLPPGAAAATGVNPVAPGPGGAQ
jgi:hypothetical protein